MDDLLREFLTETGEHLETVDLELVRFEHDPSDEAILRNVFRLVHTIKGTCGFLGLPRLEALTHAAETLMGRLRDGMPVTSEAVTLILATVDRIKMILAELDRVAEEPQGQDADIIAALGRAAGLAGEARPDRRPAAPAEPDRVSPDELERAFQAAPGPDPNVPAASDPPAKAERADAPEQGGGRAKTIRVAVDTLEHLMTMVSELVLTRNQLLDVARRTEGEGGFKIPLQRLSHVTAELQEGIMKTRMQPIGSAWAKLPRIVRDLAPELGKRVELVMVGAETELDRQILDLVRDPLTHMVRNSVDHGIEPPELRVLHGKPARGTIRLNAFHEGGTITIEIADDGRGLDHTAIRRRGASLGLAPAAELDRMSDDQVAKLIFHPGFTTQDTVSAVSGRGVGMDVVKTNIAAIGGTVEVASEPGQGSLFTIKIPLTLAIVAALIVEAAGQRFAVPQASVIELVHVRPGSLTPLESIAGATVLRLRNELLPVVGLAALLGLGEAGRPAAEVGFVVVLQVGRRRFGLLVDAVLETEEIVVKPMTSRLRHLAAFSGNTILGDGAIVLILDPNGIARAAGSDLMRGLADLAAPDRAAEAAAEAVTLLIFRGEDRSLKALPLSVVTRLEEVDAGLIQDVGGGPSLPYRGRLMPIVPIDGPGRLRSEGLQPLIVISDGGRHVALAVHEIVDVIESGLEIDPAPARPDLVGCAIVQGRATEIVDIAHHVPALRGMGAGRSAPDARSLLLVDDNAFFRDLLAPVLKAAGFRVRTAASAAEAIRMLDREPADALVADLDLPDRSGLDLVEDIRRQPAMRNATVILLASAVGDDGLERAHALGVHDVVAKFDRSGLMAALSEAAAIGLDLAA